MVLISNFNINDFINNNFFFIMIISLFVGSFLTIKKNQQINYNITLFNTKEDKDLNKIEVEAEISSNSSINENKNNTQNIKTANNQELKKSNEKPKKYMSKTGRVYKKTEFDEDDIVMTPEQQEEFWAEYYYTKSKKLEKKDVEKNDPINEKNEKLFKLFWWFLILNFITLFICLVYEAIDMNGLINYAMTTKLHSHKDIYAETIKKIIGLNLDEMNVTPAGESFIQIIQSQIIDETLTEDNLLQLIKLCNIQEEHINSKYKLLYCMLETFINHYQELSTQDTGKIRFIVRLCYTYCTTVQLPYNKFDLIRIIRFIYNNYYKK